MVEMMQISEEIETCIDSAPPPELLFLQTDLGEIERRSLAGFPKLRLTNISAFALAREMG
jgi:hypothetical protein